MRAALVTIFLMTQSAWAEVPRVVVDIAPVHSLVAQVMDGVGTPTLLLGQGADPHDFQLRPSQARAVARADLVVWIGPSLAPWLDRVLDTLGDAAASRELLEIEALPMRVETPEVELRAGAELFATVAYDGPTVVEDHDGDNGDEHADGHGHDDAHDDEHAHEEARDGGHGADHADTHKDHGAGHDHAGHDHGPVDPHAWLDPANAAVFLRVIAADLAALDPENAALYAANATAAVKRLAALHADLSTRLASAGDLPILTSHDAYRYFLTRYDLQITGSLRDSHAGQPSAARLSALLEHLDTTTPGGCVFLEPGEDPALLDGLGLGAAFRVGTFDPTGALLKPGPDLYADLIEAMATAIETCAAAKT